MGLGRVSRITIVFFCSWKTRFIYIYYPTNSYEKAFEIPLTEVANTTVSGKSEVSVEFSLPRHEKGEKIQEDSLVEVRFYIPGGVTEGMIREGDNEGKVLRDRVDENADEMDVEEDLENGEISQKVLLFISVLFLYFRLQLIAMEMPLLPLHYFAIQSSRKVMPTLLFLNSLSALLSYSVLPLGTFDCF